MTDNNQQWARIYSLTKEIYKLAPWNWMFETDIFGIQIPDTEKIYFISVMGSGGEFPGISAYRGQRALQQFWQLIEKEDMARPEELLLIPYLILSFTNKDELSKEQLSSIKSSGLKFRSEVSWPSLEENIPGFLPVLPEGDSVSDTVIILEQAIDVFRRTANNPDLIFHESDEGAYLIREKVEANAGNGWTERFIEIDLDLPEIKYKAEFSEEKALRVSSFPEKKFILQLDLVMLPNPIKEKDKKGYFPFFLLMIDKNDGYIVGNELLTPEPDVVTMYESLPGEVLSQLENLKKRPLRIEVRSPIIKQLLSPALKSAGVRLLQTGRLDLLDEAVSSLISGMKNGSLNG